MADSTYTPPKIWTNDSENGGKFASINRPTAGARFDQELPRGKHPFQLYSLATPNGVKVTVMFEELLAKGFSDASTTRFYQYYGRLNWLGFCGG